MLRKLLGIAPQPDGKDGYTPSPLALRIATVQKTDYTPAEYPRLPGGVHPRILILCTEEKYLTMHNGKNFSTGNHPVEMLVPMLHFEQAGFAIDICTPTGRPAQIEEWALPRKDRAVMDIYHRYQARLQSPQILSEIAGENEFPWVAIFIPGGHGALLGLPENRNLGRILHRVVAEDKFVLSICHGPAALLAANIDRSSDNFLFEGKKMVVFPDSLDRMTPLFGYMPGKLPWYFGEKLQMLGVEIVNRKAKGACRRDGKLITGDSPQAANSFGKMAAMVLVDYVSGP